MIPEQIRDLQYSKHSIQERLWEEHGSIETVPKHFFRIGCKKCEEAKRGCIAATYIYDDHHDLTLIIHTESKLVVTNYLSAANNVNQYKGRFRVTFKQKKNKIVASF